MRDIQTSHELCSSQEDNRTNRRGRRYDAQYHALISHFYPLSAHKASDGAMPALNV
jgi:hypothetical protein